MTLATRTGLRRINPAHGGQIQGGARRMRIIATGLLVAMAALYLAARAQEPAHPAWGYVRAFAEAAMVGGLADWFAVTALFRHPLGLPIPHTAIIPRNKDRIGDTLAVFLRDNFLTPSIVARRMRRVNAAAAAGRFLAAPPEDSAGRLRGSAARLAGTVIEALADDKLGGMVKGAVVNRLRALDIAPLLGQTLRAAMAEDRHRPMLDGMIAWASRTLDANEALIRDMVNRRAGAILRWTGLDEKLATAIFEGLQKMFAEMAADSAHPLRLKAEEALANLARDLQHDPATQAKVAALKAELIASPAVAAWIDGLWQQARAGMLRAAHDPASVSAGKFGETLRQLGATLQTDAALGRTINLFVRRATVGAVADYGDAIVRLVSDTVRGWDAKTITGRLEAAVGRDLQYIRVNGTLVGGLVGLSIHAANHLL